MGYPADVLAWMVKVLVSIPEDLWSAMRAIDVVSDANIALMRGRAHASARQTATVLVALRQICMTISPDDDDLALATQLVAEHDLMLYDAVYAAVARRRDVPLATLDQQLVDAGLGIRPDRLLAQLAEAH